MDLLLLKTTIEDFEKELYNKLSLKKVEPHEALENRFRIHGDAMNHYRIITYELNKARKSLAKKRLDHLIYLKTKANISYDNKDEYETAIQGQEEIADFHFKIRSLEVLLRSIEESLKKINSLVFDIKTYIDWKRFTEGN
jgi:hypothetical protein